MQSRVTHGTSQGNRPALPTGQVRTKAVAAPPTIAPTTTAPSKDLLDVTKNDIGKRATQEELDKYLSSYVSSQIERVKYIAPENIIGQIPKDLRGTLFRNGPGNFEYGRDEPGSKDKSKQNGHPFEGDGLLWNFAFEDDGKIFMRKKFARTKCLQEEMKAGKLLYKGAFTIGNQDDHFVWPFDFSNIRKPSNTGVIHWGGKVLALNEGDLPFLMDTELNSLGSSTLDIWSEKQMQCAHYRITQEADGSRRLCTLGFQSGSTDYPATIKELDESNNVVASTDYTIKDAAFGFFHDLAVTDNYYCLIENPMRMDFWKLLTQYGLGRECISGCLYMDTDRPQKIHLIPRPGKAKAGEEAKVFDASTKFTFHQIHAWENSKGAVVLDVLGKNYQAFKKLDLDNLPVRTFEYTENQTTARRMVCQGDTGKAVDYDLRESDVLRWRDVELPAIPPPQYTCKPHDAIIGMANRDTQTGATGIHQSVVKINIPHQLGVTQPWDPSRISIEEYYPGDGRYCLEPLFVPKPNAEVGDTFKGKNGYIIVHVQDLRVEGEHTTWLEILDAEDLAAGPVAAINLQELIPPGLHGYWTETQLGPTDNELNLPTEGWVNDIKFNL